MLNEIVWLLCEDVKLNGKVFTSIILVQCTIRLEIGLGSLKFPFSDNLLRNIVVGKAALFAYTWGGEQHKNTERCRFPLDMSKRRLKTFWSFKGFTDYFRTSSPNKRLQHLSSVIHLKKSINTQVWTNLSSLGRRRGKKGKKKFKVFRNQFETSFLFETKFVNISSKRIEADRKRNLFIIFIQQ